MPDDLPPASNDMVTEISNTKGRSTIKHTLKYLGKSPEFDLLQASVLPDCRRAKEFKSDLAATVWLQRRLHLQYYRAISANPYDSYRLTYCLNCKPAGFQTNFTRTCNNAKGCPWCFVRRRLIPARLALLSVPQAEREHSQLIYCRQALPWSRELPFFSFRAGPHQWTQAKATVQMVLPGVEFPENNLKFFRVICQVVPDRVFAYNQLCKRIGVASVRYKGYASANDDNIVACLGEATQLPWLNLFQPENLGSFQSLLQLATSDRQHYIRANRYKPKGI